MNKSSALSLYTEACKKKIQANFNYFNKSSCPRTTVNGTIHLWIKFAQNCHSENWKIKSKEICASLRGPLVHTIQQVNNGYETHILKTVNTISITTWTACI